MKIIFVVNGEVVGVGSALARGASIQPVVDCQQYTVDDNTQAAVGWSCTEVDGLPTFQAPTPTPPTIGPNQFYFLWSIDEQVAIEELRTTSTGVKLFMRRLDDPRTTEVVLSDPTVQAAVRLTVAGLVEMGVVKAEDAEQRAAAIIAGPQA